jgi:F-type H+-transporting ATPase subunit epsilon
MDNMKLEIITPDKKLFEGEAKSLTVPGSEGSLGILNNHAPMIASLKKGTVKITDNAAHVHTFEINGGVVEVLKNNVIVLAE